MDQKKLDDILDSCLDEFDEEDRTAPPASTPSTGGSGAPPPPLLPSGVPGEPVDAKLLEEIFKTVGVDGSDSGNPELQDAITKTLRMLQESGKAFESQEAQGLEPTEEQVAKLTQEFEQLSGNKEFQGMMETLMKQLLSKETLYEPLSQILELYPAWLAENESKLDPEQFAKYKTQRGVIEEIIRTFDERPDDFDRIVELMQSMQELGQPPAEIMKTISPEGENPLPNLGGAGGAGVPNLDPSQCSLM